MKFSTKNYYLFIYLSLLTFSTPPCPYALLPALAHFPLQVIYDMVPTLWFLLLCVPIYFCNDTHFHSFLFTCVQISKVFRENKRRHMIFVFLRLGHFRFLSFFILFLLFFSMGESTSIVYGCHIFIIHSSVRSHLDWLQFLGS